LGEKRWQLPFCHLLYDLECHRTPRTHSLHKGVSNQPSSSLRIGSFNHTRKLSDAFLSNISQFFAMYKDIATCPTMIFKSHSFADPAMRRWFLGRLHQFGIPLSSTYLLPFASTDTSHFYDFATIDLHLDSFPICGTTTTFDSLAMRTPVLTTPNGLYAGSVSSGILSAFGMSDFILDSDVKCLTPDLLHVLVEKQRQPSFWSNYESLLRKHLLESPPLFYDQICQMLKTKRL